MDKILNLDNVDQYNSLYGLETLNPLVSVIDLNKATRQMDYVHWNYGVYALYLKLEKACDIKYGRRSYDYQEGTVVCFAPGTNNGNHIDHRPCAVECAWHSFSSGFVTGDHAWKNNKEIYLLFV